MVTGRFGNLWGSVSAHRLQLVLLILMASYWMTTDAFLRTETLSHSRYFGIGSFENRAPVISIDSKHECSSGCRQGLPTSSRRTTKLYFMGSDNGLLGVGGPEIFTIILVGYFVLGPSDLYKLVKEIGKFLQNIRTLGTDLSTTFENNMESSLQLDELRKAQRELNDAFSFRRSINVDADSEAFSVQAGSAQKAEAMAAMASTAAAVGTNEPAKKIRRRMRKKVALEDEASVPLSEVPDLEMPGFDLSPAAKETSKEGESLSDEEAAIIEAEFNQYVKTPFETWDDWNGGESAVNSTATTALTQTDPTVEKAARSRFQQQLSGGWNEQILSAGDKLEPMAVVMNKIALLEQEKAATLKRLEDEFAKRSEIEEKYYREQRQLLEEAVSEVQSAAFGLDSKPKS